MTKKWITSMCFLLLCLFSLEVPIWGQETAQQHLTDVPLVMVFHNIGWNILHAVTYNYGLPFIGAAAGTWAFIETGIDWQWNRLAYNNTALAKSGLPSLYIGYVIPAITPVALYLTGYFTEDISLQMTGLALTQSLLLTIGIQSILKGITSRAKPGIITELDHTRSPRTDDFSNEFEWFKMEFISGWPSGHTANAFAAAATISEMYKDNVPLKIGVYSYAVLIGLGVSVNVHWASEVFAGALIGYAIGKTVGKSFSQLGGKQEERLSLCITHNFVGFRITIK